MKLHSRFDSNSSPQKEEKRVLVADVHSPTMSVVIPTYNRAELLPRALNSVLAQTFADFELIVVDDGSSDDTREVVAGIDDPRLKYVRQSRAGAATARNTGVAVSQGKYLTFLDSDDEVAVDWLETMIDGFRQHDADIVCCGLIKDWSQVRSRQIETITRPGKLGGLFEEQVGLFMGGTFALKREIFDHVGGYIPGLASGHHTEFSFRLLPEAKALGWRIHNCMKPLVRVHVHPGSRVRSDWAAVLEGTAYLLTAHGERYARHPRSKSQTCGVAGVASVKVGDFATARRYFRDAVAAEPRSLSGWARLLVSFLPPIAKRVWRD